MANNLQATTTLYNGVKMPWFGLGVFKVEEGPELVQAVKIAIKQGYRSMIPLLFMGMKKALD
jgi:methylglyoxal/glyoxal reductase